MEQLYTALLMYKRQYVKNLGTRSGTVGRGIVLPAGRLRVRFTVFTENPSGCTTALESTQPLTEMNTRNIFLEVKATGV